MNVVFLLLAAASPGSHPAPAPEPAPCSTCSGGCGATSAACGSDCCDKPGWRDRLRGMFAKKSDCCEPCCTPTPAPCCTHTPTTCCGPTSGCCDADPCAAKPSLFDRFRGMFGKKDDGCCCQPTTSGCCDHGHATAAPAAPSHNAHPVPAMPAPAVGHNTAPAPHAQMPTGNVPMPHAQMPATHQPRPNAPVMINQPHVPITNPQQQVITPAPTQGGKVIQSPLPVGNKGAEQIQRQPKEENKEGARMMPTPVVQPAAAKVETELKNPFDSARRDVQRGSHAADYSKLTGRLYYVHADGGLWVLRYASLDVDDGKGGSVILARDRQMNHYREGDLVTVEGEVISDKGSTRLGGPLYRVRSIVLVDRPK